MKYLMLLLVIVVVGWLAFGRRRPPPPLSRGPAKSKAPPDPQVMLACAHCAVHLPQADAQFDSAGRPFCSEAHRLAGPR